ncbi:MAG: ABC transporter substrate-binding protein [Candidatus Rokuibacteriota bacterium]|nr:MAG: ABC transporter substrate-binding protein [Candidatus Rokubacteria bacterium]
MRLICLAVILAVSLILAPLAAEGQQAEKRARIGYLSSGTATANAGLRKAFTDGLRDHGWIEEKNIAIEYRWEGAGKPTLDALAAELARLPLDAIFAVDTPASLAMKRTGTTLPVVFATVSEPVVIGLVDSLSRPGRNFTGLTTINRELMPKRLEVLKETIPGLTRVAYLANPGYEVHKAQLTEMGAAARSLGLTLHLAEVRAPSEFEGAFARMAAAHVGAFIVQQDPLFVGNRALVIDSATQRRLPGMYVFSLYPRSGGFMSYGAHAEDLYRRAAEYVDRILKGAKPSDLPVERPTKFELVINLKTAKALGLTIPPTLLLQADQVIE